MVIEVVFDVLLKRLRMKDPAAPADSLWDELNGNIYRLTGNVGIDTNTPTEKLHVVGIVLADSFKNILDSDEIGYISKKLVNSSSTYPLIVEASGGFVAGGLESFNTGKIIVLSGNVATPADLHKAIYCMEDGTVGIGGETFDTEFQVHGFTKLGADNTPGIKIKKLEITLSGAQGGTASILTGMHSSKIISVAVLVRGPNSTVYPPRHQAVSNNEFDYYLDVDSLYVVNHGTNSSNIVSDVATVVLIYEE